MELKKRLINYFFSNLSSKITHSINNTPIIINNIPNTDHIFIMSKIVIYIYKFLCYS